jgi:hypothetical protein
MKGPVDVKLFPLFVEDYVEELSEKSAVFFFTDNVDFSFKKFINFNKEPGLNFW